MSSESEGVGSNETLDDSDRPDVLSVLPRSALFFLTAFFFFLFLVGVRTCLSVSLTGSGSRIRLDTDDWREGGRYNSK